MWVDPVMDFITAQWVTSVNHFQKLRNPNLGFIRRTLLLPLYKHPSPILSSFATLLSPSSNLSKGFSIRVSFCVMGLPHLFQFMRQLLITCALILVGTVYEMTLQQFLSAISFVLFLFQFPLQSRKILCLIQKALNFTLCSICFLLVFGIVQRNRCMMYALFECWLN